MKPIFYIIIVLALVFSCKSHSDTESVLGEGVPQEIAEYRKQQVSDVHYDLSFDIPLTKEDSIPSELTLDLTIHDLKKPLYLDFKQDTNLPLSISVNEKDVPVKHEKEHLIIPAQYLAVGNNKINIKFIAGELSLNRNEDYLYTLLVPDRARTLFPCFDQPDIKANYTLIITAPKDWKVLCASPLQLQKEKGDFVQYQFEESDKMSTYHFSFVAGKFEAFSNNSETFEMQMLYRETNPEKIKASIEPIFDLHQLSIDFLEEYTNYKFPFQKLDLAAIPGFQYGGMEHIGAIQYRESKLFLDSSATLSKEISRAKVIAHETSHLWFGDLVTMKWFDDVWLKEVFANLMADKIINPAFKTINHDLQFLTSHYPSAYNTDRTRGTHPIRQNLDNLKNAGSLYGSIIYNKSPIMMRQLEATLGEDKFQEGISEYIKTYANNNADWNDLIEILDAKTSMDLNQWSNVWVNSSGRPIILGKVKYDSTDRIKSFEIEQEAEDGTNNIWPQFFDISFVYPDSTLKLSVDLNDKKMNILSAEGLPKPDFIIYNSNGFGYGVFPVDLSRLETIPAIKDDVARGYCYINCYENTLKGNIPLAQAFDLYLKGLDTESNELILRLISGKIRSIYWKYFTADQREIYQSTLEKLLFDRLLVDSPSNIKKTLFTLFKSIAYSKSGVDRLYRIWNKDLLIHNLTLNEDDYTNLAMILSVYEHENAGKILKKARAGISNPDKLKRFEFLLPSLSHDERIRSAFFESFREEKNREKENWVLRACYYIHHPLRQEFAIKNLATSLELLEEIQRTGDIFFPKGWLDNTIGMYSSGEASEIFESFISTHPDLDPSLMNKLLQSTDDLYRTQKLL